MPRDDFESELAPTWACALGGDGLAYRQALVCIAARLRGYFSRRLTALPDEVEDLVQETLLAVHNKRHTYQPEQPVTAWLHAIARYKLIDMLRARSSREALHDPIDEDSSALMSDAEPAAQEARRDLRVLLARLPDKQRLPIEYVKIEGLSVAQAAQLTGLSESAVKVGVHRGLKLLAAGIRAGTQSKR